MSDLTDIDPGCLKGSLCRNGVWNQDSFTHIATTMFYYRPSRWLYQDVFTSRDMAHKYTQLVHMACQYADDMAYPWMKTKLKDIVLVDFKGFYNILAQLIRDKIKKMPFTTYDEELMSMLAGIWVKVGTFTDIQSNPSSFTMSGDSQIMAR